MAKLTIIENGISSADMIAAINANFAFISSLSSMSTSLVTITNAMQGQVLLDNINYNFIAINARATDPISLSAISIGITGATLNTLFTNLLEGIGRGMIGRGYFVEYEVSELHICTTRGKKRLAFDGKDTISLSIDDGKTYPYSKQLVGMEDMISYAYIWLTGEIMFCTETKAYYSHDNLTTVNESSVIGIDGNAFVPEADGNFSPLGLGQYHKDDIPYWGVYSSGGSASLNKVNAWYSIDKGITVKSWFKSGVSLGIPAINHIHVINYDVNSDSFIIQTGDANNGCRWIKGVYNSIADTWTLTVLKTGTAPTYFKTTGFVWNGEDAYWIEDTTDAAFAGIWTCKYADILDEDKYVRTFVGSTDYYGMIGDGTEFLITKNAFYVSLDAVNVYTHTIPGISGLFASVTPKNDNGFYRSDINTSEEAEGGLELRNMYKGSVVLFKINH